jgi:hypothetical protein
MKHLLSQGVLELGWKIMLNVVVQVGQEQGWEMKPLEEEVLQLLQNGMSKIISLKLVIITSFDSIPN